MVLVNISSPLQPLNNLHKSTNDHNLFLSSVPNHGQLNQWLSDHPVALPLEAGATSIPHNNWCTSQDTSSLSLHVAVEIEDIMSEREVVDVVCSRPDLTTSRNSHHKITSRNKGIYMMTNTLNIDTFFTCR